MRLTLLTLVLLIAASLAGCRQSSSADAAGFGDTIYAPRHAAGFSILGRAQDSSTIVSVGRPWQGADTASPATSLLILRGGAEAPSGYTGPILRDKARRIAAMSTTHVAMLEELGAAGTLVGLSGKEYSSSKSVRSRIGSIAEIGYEGNIDYERLVGSRPDLVLLSSVSGPSSMESKLRELNIPYLYVGDYCEEDPVGKAEWIVALGEVTGHRNKAAAIADSIRSRYEKVKSRVGTAVTRPTVMFNAPYNDVWFMPFNRSYGVRLIEDAGATHVEPGDNGTTSHPVSLEEAYMLARKADFWLNPGDSKSIAALRDALPRFAEIPAVVNGKVWSNTLRASGGGNDYWESGIVHPDLILRDLIKIFHPELVSEPFVYYRHLE